MSEPTKEGLIKVYRLSLDPNWIYAGGRAFDPICHNNYWQIFYKSRNWSGKMPHYKFQCVCGKQIERECFIYNVKTKKIKIIGIDCIKKFNIDKRICAECGIEHNNRKNNFCDECRKGKCVTCLKSIDPKYTKCYKCKFNR